MTRTIVFVLASMPIACLSRHSFHRPRGHGFYRFFAFESILALFLLNLKSWFSRPFSPLQILSWLLLCGSGGLAIHGFHLLRALGRPSGRIENTTILVEAGAYRYIRHPLYASLVLLATGICLKRPSLKGSALTALAWAFLYRTAKVEEGEMRERFGEEYTAHMRRTRMFVPFLF